MEKEFKKKGWEVVVISEEDDLTTEFGINKAVAALTGPGDVLWHSQPCTGGCPWQRINIKRNPVTKEKVKKHWKLFATLWKSFEIVAKHALSVGASVYNEWPQGCSYWANKRVSTFLQKKRFNFTAVHGCMYDLKAECGTNKGMPIKKPWKIAYSTGACNMTLDICDGSHTHTPCAGGDTVKTENYTPDSSPP